MALSLRKQSALLGGARRSATSCSLVVSVNAYKVTLKGPSGSTTIECPADVWILVSIHLSQSDRFGVFLMPQAQCGGGECFLLTFAAVCGLLP